MRLFMAIIMTLMLIGCGTEADDVLLSDLSQTQTNNICIELMNQVAHSHYQIDCIVNSPTQSDCLECLNSYNDVFKEQIVRNECASGSIIDIDYTSCMDALAGDLADCVFEQEDQYKELLKNSSCKSEHRKTLSIAVQNLPPPFFCQYIKNDCKPYNERY